jgi:hypothetical protein
MAFCNGIHRQEKSSTGTAMITILRQWYIQVLAEYPEVPVLLFSALKWLRCTDTEKCGSKIKFKITGSDFRSRISPRIRIYIWNCFNPWIVGPRGIFWRKIPVVENLVRLSL